MAVRSKGNLSDLESLIGYGENPKGFVGQTVNGSTRATGLGWNQAKPYNGRPEAEAGGAWQPGRSNRTGE